MNKKIAIQFGAGNIGRGLNAVVLHRNNFEICFVNISASLNDRINQINQYHVTELTSKNNQERIIDNYYGLHLQNDYAKIIQKIAEAEVIFTAVTFNKLSSVADILSKGLNQKIALNNKKPINIVAIENGIQASSFLQKCVEPLLNVQAFEALGKTIAFSNCAVDRIVPAQEKNNLDIQVESFYELVIDKNSWLGTKLNFVDYNKNLLAFIERKLYMLNAVHAFIAWYGIRHSLQFIYQFQEHEKLVLHVKELLANFVVILEHKFHFEKSELEQYANKIIERLSNLQINDEVTRVGRNVLLKVSYNERFVRPLRYAIENKLNYQPILKALAYGFSGLKFEDAEAIKLNQELKKNKLKIVIQKNTGLKNDIIIQELTKLILKIK